MRVLSEGGAKSQISNLKFQRKPDDWDWLGSAFGPHGRGGDVFWADSVQRQLPISDRQRSAFGVEFDGDFFRRYEKTLASAFEIGFFQDPLFEESLGALARWQPGQSRSLGFGKKMAGDLLDIDAGGDFFGVYANLAGAGDDANHQAGGVGEVESQIAKGGRGGDGGLAEFSGGEFPIRGVDAGIFR